MHTIDGCAITTIEQEGAYVGEDIGRLWIQDRNTWTWYGNFASETRRQEVIAQAQAMTAQDFDRWFDTAP